MLLSVIVFLVLQAPAEKPGIYGVIRDATTNAPLAEARVRLLDSGRRVIEERPTAANGSYSFDLAPGRYFLQVERSGYISRYHGQELSSLGTQIVVEQDKRSDTSLRLLRSSSVGGRLSGSDRSPVPNVEVRLQTLGYGINQEQTLRDSQFVRPVRTNPNGDYNFLDVPPGDYYLHAVMGATKVFYPGVSSIQQAVPIKVTAGDQVTRDFDLIAREAFTVSGRMVSALLAENPSSSTRNPTMLFLVPQGNRYGGLVESPSPLVAQNSRGDFEFRNVLPGIYDLWAGIPLNDTPSAPFATGMVTVEVKDKNVGDVVLPVQPGTNIPGRFQMASAGGNVSMRELDLMMMPVGGMPTMIGPTARVRNLVGQDGTFLLTSIKPGRYTIHGVTPRNLYVSAIRFGSRDVLGYPVDIEAGSEGPLVLEISADGGRFEGITVDSTDKPVGGAQIVLVPPVPFREDVTAYRIMVSDTEGRFSIPGIRPGVYTAYAFAQIENNAWANLTYMAPYAALGVPADIGRSQTVTKNLKVISR